MSDGPIPEHYIRTTCRIGQGEDCCRYLVATPDGMQCAKADPSIAPVILQRIAEGTFGARGDHCPGWDKVRGTL